MERTNEQPLDLKHLSGLGRALAIKDGAVVGFIGKCFIEAGIPLTDPRALGIMGAVSIGIAADVIALINQHNQTNE